MNSVQFPNTPTTKPASPWSQPRRTSTYDDAILKPEFASRRLILNPGENWLRIVPAEPASAYDWLLPLHVINHDKGRFLHPRSLAPNAKSVFDHAYSWSLKHAPGGLYSKANKSGVRLLTDPAALCWVIKEEQDKPVARIFLAGAYDGSRGGQQALGFRVWDFCANVDPKISDASPLDPNNGVLICIEKIQPKGAKYPSYTIKLGRQPRPVAELLNAMDAEERAALCPLENVVRKLDEEEQWARLAQTIAPETVKIIRDSLNR